MKIALLDSASLRTWRDEQHRLAFLAPSLSAAGHEVIIIDVSSNGDDYPIIAGSPRESDIQPLIESTRAAALLRGDEPAVCILPSRGGLAHGLLMMRACHECAPTMRIMLVSETPSRIFLDPSSERLRPLVADAMELFCLSHADSLLCGDLNFAHELCDLPVQLPPVVPCLPCCDSESIIISTDDHPTELFFVGPFDRTHKVQTFIDAIERIFLSTSALFERVTFCGPIPDAVRSIGKEWLGRRALKWSKPFRVVETTTFADAIEHVMQAKCVAFFPNLSPGLQDIVAERAAKLTTLTKDELENATLLQNRLATISSLTARARLIRIPFDVKYLATLFLAAPQTDTIQSKTHLSICILHQDRPNYLRRAISSVQSQVDAIERRCNLIVFDNGSVGTESQQFLDDLAGSKDITLVRRSKALPHPAAMNALASHATGSHLVFLDDDNLLSDGGLLALFKACDAGSFDVVTSNLYVFDTGDDDPPKPAAILAFVGPAQSAGLFFNAFGDTCMAVRRTIFETLGGFLDSGGPLPAPDWLFLARAQAAEFKIGVLQKPAFFYRRDIGKADLNAQKFDQHGLRQLLLTHYGRKYDAKLIIQLAQRLVVSAI